MNLNQSRRRFLKQLVLLSGLAAINGMLVSGCGENNTGLQTGPLTQPEIPPNSRSTAKAPVKTNPLEELPPGFEQVAPVSSFKPGENPQGFAIRGRNVLVYNSGSNLYVFDEFCTHQGCQVEYSETAHKFICPCHGSEFDKTGRVIKGPALLPLNRVEYKIIDNIIVVNLANNK